MKKNKKAAFLIKVFDLDGPIETCFIDDVVLYGDKEQLYINLLYPEFVKKTGIHESFYGKRFTLIPENEVDFPEYSC